MEHSLEDSDLNKLLFEDVVPKLRGPSFVYWLPALEEATEYTKTYWSSLFQEKTGKTFASVKANPCLPLLKAISPFVDGFDVSSLEEMQMLISAGTAPGRLTLSGPAKQDELLTLALQKEIQCLHLDNLEEVEKICSEPNQNTPITLRLSPDYFSIKQGMSNGEAEAAIKVLRNNGRKLSGLHIYLGRESFSDENLFTALESATTFIKNHDADFTSKELFLGAGFLGQGQQSRWPKLDAKEVHKKTGPLSKIHLETGRGIFESCGYYLTTVLSVKATRARPIVIIDGGNHHFAEKLVSETGVDQPYFPVAQSLETKIKMLVAGSLCQDRDVLHPSCDLPANLKRGDWLIFPNRGAYGLTAANSQFIGQKPASEWLGKKNADGRIQLIFASPKNFVGYHRSFFDLGKDL